MLLKNQRLKDKSGLPREWMEKTFKVNAYKKWR